ncbi:WRKY DNA-binding transcription factor 70-like [Prosopis cineraria]|uniref:WRKY DNA-binding transcription factor 70-like n=1 Tax=Prosopis cineraria TaxID=364024 RepID=UPI002410918C|nr:WRKY DNA-binding transcription factor 70-like [Prosopis cineraria]
MANSPDLALTSQTNLEKQAIDKELVRGREFTNQLLQQLRHGSNCRGDQKSLLLVTSPFAQDFVTEIVRSFTNTFLLLNTTTDPADIQSHDVSFFTDSSSDRNISHESGVAGDVDVNCKRFINRKSDDPRDCFKRESSIQTWERDSPILIDDENYYRCSHRQEGCSAMKQVQRIQEKPPLYRTTYFGLHSCKNHMLPEMTLDLTSASGGSSMLLSFNNNTSFHHPVFSLSSSSTKKDHDDDQENNIPIIHDDHDVDEEQNHVSQYDDHDHIPTLLSSTLDMFCYHEVNDVLLMRCFDFDDFARFGK